MYIYNVCIYIHMFSGVADNIHMLNRINNIHIHIYIYHLKNKIFVYIYILYIQCCVEYTIALPVPIKANCSGMSWLELNKYVA